jgi:hypothetical protein
LSSPLQFDEFEALAWREWERIPAEYRAGVDGLVIERRAVPHPTLPDVYTLGECATESYPSDFGGPDTTRSVVVLYYGSFFRLSRLDASFDWEAELWETLTHELQHHLESLAADDALVDMDYAADENFRRYEGEPFDPFFFRHGLLRDGWYRVDDEYFLEVPWPAPDAPLHFVWADQTYEVDAPAEQADVALIAVEGVDDAPSLHLAVVQHRGVFATAARLLTRRPLHCIELEATARVTEDD